jgi:hypothetical protein
MAFDLTSKSKDDVSPPTEDLESLIHKCRKDILGLKIMVYTAVILLVAGFLYYSNAEQSTHKDFDVEMQSIQRKLDKLVHGQALGTGNRLEGVVEEMNSTISRLDSEPPEVQRMIERVKEDSGDFLYTYREYSKYKAAKLRRGF